MQALASPGLLSAVEENATFAPHGDDRHDINGTNVSYTTGSLSEENILNAPTRWLGDSTFLFHRQTGETDDRLEWTILGQSIFTPENHRVSNPSLNDRPYAGWLYAGLNFIQDEDVKQLTSLEFLGDIVGPWALGRQVQNNVHALFGEELARGWNHQLGNEFGFTVSWSANGDLIMN
jgi:lipid A 3-O-deacylase